MTQITNIQGERRGAAIKKLKIYGALAMFSPFIIFLVNWLIIAKFKLYKFLFPFGYVLEKPPYLTICMLSFIITVPLFFLFIIGFCRILLKICQKIEELNKNSENIRGGGGENG